MTSDLIRSSRREWSKALNEQAANALLGSIFAFLRRNKISRRQLLEFTREYGLPDQARRRLRLYRDLMTVYDDMGLILATWFSDPRFLDSSGQPKPLSIKSGKHSIRSLIRASGAQVKLPLVLELIHNSPSVAILGDEKIVATRRVFVLPRLPVPRAAFVVKRYLETLQKNMVTKPGHKARFLERSCHVSVADLATINPILRDIDSRGTAFIDSVDGEIELCRIRNRKPKHVGEIGVLVFAWAVPRSAKQKSVIRRKAGP